MKKMFLSISLCLFTAFAFAQMEYKGQKFGAEVKPGEVKPAAKIEAAMCDKKVVYMNEGNCKKKGCWMSLEMPNGD